jgi:hypothetical protein
MPRKTTNGPFIVTTTLVERGHVTCKAVSSLSSHGSPGDHRL